MHSRLRTSTPGFSRAEQRRHPDHQRDPGSEQDRRAAPTYRLFELPDATPAKPALVVGAREITAHGGWRAYRATAGLADASGAPS